MMLPPFRNTCTPFHEDVGTSTTDTMVGLIEESGPVPIHGVRVEDHHIGEHPPPERIPQRSRDRGDRRAYGRNSKFFPTPAITFQASKDPTSSAGT